MLENPSTAYVRNFICFIHLPMSKNLLLASMIPGTIVLPIGLFIHGWSAQNHVFWIVPDIVCF